MKKVIAIVLVIVLLLVLCSCGDANNQQTPSDSIDDIKTTNSTSNLTTTSDATSTNSAHSTTTTTTSDAISTNSAHSTTTNSTNTDTTQCTHVWGQWVEKTKATCQTPGIKERSCHNCHITESEKTKTTNHKESDWIIDKVAEIGKDGLKYTKCVYCNKRIEEKVIPAIAENHQHAVAEWVTIKTPTCTASGTQNAICSCGKTVDTKDIPSKGHSPVVDKAVAATCTSNGLTEGSHCSVCDAIIVRQETVNSKGHTMSSKRVAATSNREEYTLHYCTSCPYSYEEFSATTSPIKFISHNNGTCSVTGLNDTTIENLVIPTKSPSGDTVVAVSDRAFIRNSTLKSVTLPSTVNQIGEFAFCGCTNLKAVNGSQYATTIKGSAFAESPLLTSLDLSSATTLGNYICRDMTNLSSVKLSDKLKKLPQGMFASCTSLLEINLPSSITVIGNSAFQSTNIENIVLPDSVEEIEMYAFRYCSKLKTVKLPQNLNVINPLVFERCSSLNNIILPDGLKTLGRLAFADCKSLTNINLPGTLTSVGDSCFSGCTALSSATLANGMKTIPMRLFSGCTALSSISLPPSITSIQQEAFNGTSISTLVIPDSCTSIGNSAFRGCKNLVSVSFGANLKKIDSYAFNGCKAITSICLPETFEDLGDWAFMNCSGLQKIYLGTSITNIGSGAFENCTALSNVFLPKSLQVIKTETYDKNPFTGCSGTLDIYSDAPQSNYIWERYFGLVSYGVSYDEYLKLTQ